VVEILPQILPVEDAEIAAFARKQFEKEGIKIFTGAKLTRLEKKTDGALATIEDARWDPERCCRAGHLRRGGYRQYRDLGLEKLGVKTERGAVVVDPSIANVPASMRLAMSRARRS
jgi:dihydrolipoamide dehydrogenase